MAALLLALAFTPDAGRPPCELADARAQAACEINHRSGKRERHLARMAKCDFKTEPGIKLLLLSEGPDPDHMRLIDNTTIRAQACEVPEGTRHLSQRPRRSRLPSAAARPPLTCCRCVAVRSDRTGSSSPHGVTFGKSHM